MRIAPLSINNEYYDEDYLKVFGFNTIGKNVKVHRSVVFMKPSNVVIGSNVTIGPYCVFGISQCVILDGAIIEPFSYKGQGIIDEPTKSEADRVKELEAKLAALEANNDKAV